MAKAILFLAIFFFTLWVPLYNRVTPELFGFPFFYWYQMAVVPVASLLIWVVYRIDVKKEAK